MTMQYHMWRAIASYNFLRGAGDLVRALTCERIKKLIWATHSQYDVVFTSCPNFTIFNDMCHWQHRTDFQYLTFNYIGLDSPLGKNTLQGSILVTSNPNFDAHFDNIKPCLVTIVTQTFLSIFRLVLVIEFPTRLGIILSLWTWKYLGPLPIPKFLSPVVMISTRDIIILNLIVLPLSLSS
jgi:hypothetical protein